MRVTRFLLPAAVAIAIALFGAPAASAAGSAVRVAVQCVPSDDPGFFGVMVKSPAGPAWSGTLGCGQELTFDAIPTGGYTVEQWDLGMTRWKLSDYEIAYSGDCPGGALTVAEGATAACTITRTRIAPLPPPPATVNIDVQCEPADDGGTFGVALAASSGYTWSSAMSCGSRFVYDGLPADTYSFRQWDLPWTIWRLADYATVYGGDCSPDAAVTVDWGATANCTIRWTRTAPLPPPPAQLVVAVACVPATDPSWFAVSLVQLSGASQTLVMPCGYSYTFENEPPGSYELRQLAYPWMPWRLSDYEMSYSGDCSADGSLALVSATTSHCTITRTYRADRVPPTTADDAPSGWVNHDVTVHLTASDDSGVTTTSFRLDGGSVQTGTEVTITGDGVHSLAYHSVDAAGNVETEHVVTVSIDATPPEVTWSGNVGTYGVDATIAIGCAATDALSGVSSASCNAIAGDAWSFGLGTTTRSASATDGAGNTATSSTSFTVVLTPIGLERLTRQLAGGDVTVDGLVAKIRAIAAAPTATARAGALGAFGHQLDALTGKRITAAQAMLLLQLAAQL